MSTPINNKFPLIHKKLVDDVKYLKDNLNRYKFKVIENINTIEVDSGIFYNIKDSVNNNIHIVFNKNDFYPEGSDKFIFFIGDCDDEEILQYLITVGSLGFSIHPDNSIKGYNYKGSCNLTSVGLFGTFDVYFEKEPITGIDTKCRIVINIEDAEDINIDVEFQLRNIKILNENIDYIHYLSTPMDSTGNKGTDTPCIFYEQTYVEGEDYTYEYKGYCLGGEVIAIGVENLENLTMVQVVESDMLPAIMFNVYIALNKSIPKSDYISEFLINIKTPSNITFSEPIKWNNNNIPNFNRYGTYTISIINGVGCFTFIEN